MGWVGNKGKENPWGKGALCWYLCGERLAGFRFEIWNKMMLFPGSSPLQFQTFPGDATHSTRTVNIKCFFSQALRDLFFRMQLGMWHPRVKRANFGCGSPRLEIISSPEYHRKTHDSVFSVENSGEAPTSRLFQQVRVDSHLQSKSQTHNRKQIHWILLTRKTGSQSRFAFRTETDTFLAL